MTQRPLLHDVERYYTERVREHGATPRGVDWNSAASQRLRFEKLADVFRSARSFSLNDYGCGYGALLDHLAEQSWAVEYRGFDVSAAMIAEARRLHAEQPAATFFSDETMLALADYTVASGIFNVKLDTPDEAWHEYMIETVRRLAELSRRGFAFNVLSRYSDPERRRTDLHYADPLFWFDHCKRQHSRAVALLHDYELYEFTIVVRQ
jgi:SAM-dependent methyltransferase